MADEATIHERDLAELTGYTQRHLQNLFGSGHIPAPDGAGYFELEPTLRALFTYLRKADKGDPNKAAELLAHRTRLTAHKADLAAIELARQQGNTFAAADVAAKISEIITATRARVLAIPSKAAGQFVGLETINEAHKRLKALATAALKDMAAPLSKRPAAEAPPAKK